MYVCMYMYAPCLVILEEWPSHGQPWLPFPSSTPPTKAASFVSKPSLSPAVPKLVCTSARPSHVLIHMQRWSLTCYIFFLYPNIILPAQFRTVLKSKLNIFFFPLHKILSFLEQNLLSGPQRSPSSPSHCPLLFIALWPLWSVCFTVHSCPLECYTLVLSVWPLHGDRHYQVSMLCCFPQTGFLGCFSWLLCPAWCYPLWLFSLGLPMPAVLRSKCVVSRGFVCVIGSLIPLSRARLHIQ